LVDAEQSTNLDERVASNAIDGDETTINVTGNGSSEWLKANFIVGTAVVTSVDILNRNGYGYRLAGSTVEVGGELCGTIPTPTEDGILYSV